MTWDRNQIVSPKGWTPSRGRAEPAHRRNVSLAYKVHWILRIGVALEFIGHGIAGLYAPKAWIPYFEFFGFTPEFAHSHMMYATGVFDILLGLLVLIVPLRAVLLHMTVWGLLTASLRPLTGESFFELVERGANYGMPAAFLLLSGWGTWSWRSWFTAIRPAKSFSKELATQVAWVCRVSIALFLIGHGGLGVWAHKPEWLDFFAWFGISPATVSAQHLSQWVGLFEVALGLAVAIKPFRGLLAFVLVWKLGTELLRPLVGQNNYQFVERAGDYALPMALILIKGWLLNRRRVARRRHVAPATRAAVAGCQVDDSGFVASGVAAGA